MFALGPALKISRSAVVTDLKEHAGEDVVRRRWKFYRVNPLVVRANRVLARAHYCCGLVHSWCRQSRVRRYRTKTGRKLHSRSRCEPGWLRTETRAGTLSQLERETGGAAGRGAREHFFNRSVRDV